MSRTDWIQEARDYPLKRGLSYDDLAQHYCLLVEHPSPEQLADWLGMPVNPLPEAVWVFPNLFQDNGDTLIHNRTLRLFPPDGKRKFLATKDVPARPYILLETGAVASHLDVPLLICEKQIIAILARKLGYHAIALGGTFEAAEKRFEGEKVKLHPVLKQFAWSGRTVWLGFDSDYSRREGVLQGLVRTFLLLLAEGAIPKLLRWESAFSGLDDFLASKSANDPTLQKAAFEELLSPLTDIDLKAAAAAWITTSMLKFFEREGAIVEMSPAVRNQLAHLLAKPLGVSVGSLEKVWGRDEAKADPTEGNLFQASPIPWPEEVDPLDLLQRMDRFIQRFVVMTLSERVLVAFWNFLPWTYELWAHLAILRVTSPEKQCGKSTLLDLLERLLPNPLLTINISTAALYRLIETYHPTVLVDEADSFALGREDFRNIACGGYDRGRPVYRVNPDTMQVEKFDTFGCRVIASIGSLHETVEDRSIFVQLTRKPFDVETDALCDVPSAEFEELQRMYARCVADHLEVFRLTKLKRPKFLASREWDKYRPLLTIASVFDCYEVALKAFTTVMRAYDAQTSVRIEILLRMRELFKVCPREKKFYFTQEVVTALNRDKEAPWADLKDQLTQKTLGQHLRPFGIKSQNARHGSGNRFKAYFYKDFEKVFAAYLGFDFDSTPTAEQSPGPEPKTENAEPYPQKGQKIRTMPGDQVPEPSEPVQIESENPPSGQIDERKIRTMPGDQVPEPSKPVQIQTDDPYLPREMAQISSKDPYHVSPLPEPLREPGTDLLPFSEGDTALSCCPTPPDTAQGGFEPPSVILCNISIWISKRSILTLEHQASKMLRSRQRLIWQPFAGDKNAAWLIHGQRIHDDVP